MSGKLALIGAGSGMFSLNLVRDICLTKNMAGFEICLMDIDQERLDNIHEFCSRYAEEVGNDLTVTKTTNRIEALRGANFVVHTALAASHAKLQEGWEIAKKYGYRFGGSLQIMHDESFWINFYQFRLMEDILRDIRRICPDAWYLVVANPVVTGITYLKRKYPDSNIVGMCHGFAGIYRLCEKLGIKEEDISFESIGVNHFVFLNRFYCNGKDAYLLLDKWIEEKSAEYFKEVWYSDFEGPMAVDLYKKYGLWPVGDTATPGGGSWPWWYHSSDEVQEKWREKPIEGYLGYFSWVASQAKLIKDNAFDYNKRLSDIFPPVMSGEPVIPLVEALHCGVERVVIVNILNDGEYIEGIPRDFQVEIPAFCSSRGVQGIRCNSLPKHILSFIYRDKIAPCEMELAAFSEGDYDLLLAMVLMDPFTQSEAQARAFLDDILDLEWNTAMKEHYKKKA
jgi:alpha-galactosidase